MTRGRGGKRGVPGWRIRTRRRAHPLPSRPSLLRHILLWHFMDIQLYIVLFQNFVTGLTKYQIKVIRYWFHCSIRLTKYVVVWPKRVPFSAFLKSLVCLSKASKISSGMVARETLLTTCDELVPLYPWISAVNTDSISPAASAVALSPFGKLLTLAFTVWIMCWKISVAVLTRKLSLVYCRGQVLYWQTPRVSRESCDFRLWGV